MCTGPVRFERTPFRSTAGRSPVEPWPRRVARRRCGDDGECVPGSGSRVSSCPSTVPRRPTTDHGPAGTAAAFFPQTITCQTAADAPSVGSSVCCLLLRAATSTPRRGQDAKRPAWRSAQAGRVVPLPDRGGWSHSTEYAPCPRSLHRLSDAGADNPAAPRSSLPASPRTHTPRANLAPARFRRTLAGPSRRVESPVSGTPLSRARRRACSSARRAGSRRRAASSRRIEEW